MFLIHRYIDMYKNQLQELAQRSCFNLPSYACVKEGPNHAPRFKASVNFNGEIFESQTYCTTLRQAEHSAAEFALNVLSSRGPSRSLTARVLDETGIYKNLLQETAHRAGLKLPVYTTVRSGPGHVPTFTCSVEIASMSFTGDSAKTKKQAEKNAAIAAWSALNRVPGLVSLAPTAAATTSKGERSTVLRGSAEDVKLMDLIMDLGNGSKEAGLCCSLQRHRNGGGFASLVPPPPPRTASKILPPRPMIPVHVRTITRSRNSHAAVVVPPPLEDHLRDEEEWLGSGSGSGKKIVSSTDDLLSDNTAKFKALSESSVRYRHPHRIAPAVHIRSVIPVCSAPPQPQPQPQPKLLVPKTQPSSSSKSNNDQLQSTTQLGTEFNKLQL